MDRRLELDALLQTIVSSVYFQPPTGKAMSYPCIVYNLEDEHTDFADNHPYRHKAKYEVTVIDMDPDSTIRSQIRALPSALFNRFFVSDNLNHFVYTLYF